MASTITSAEEAQINKMNVASQRASLGTVVKTNQSDIVTLQAGAVVTGSYGASLADVDGSAIEILTGETGIIGYIVNVSRSGSSITSFVENSGSNLMVRPITTGSMSTWTSVAENDRVDWIVF